MVSGFRRSLSSPNPAANGGSSAALAEKSRRHIRSTTLPCRFHPLVSQLNDAIRTLRCWESERVRSLAWAVDGLVRLDHLHGSFVDLLNLTQSNNTLRTGGADWSDRLLDGFLRLADAHGTFRCAVIELRQHQSATQAAIRGKDEAHLASCLRSQRRAEKELSRMASAICIASGSSTTALPVDGPEAVELAGIMREVRAVTATASAAVFKGVAAAASTESVTAPRWLRFWRKEGDQKKRWNAFEKLEAMEKIMRALEEKSENVFRSLVNTRVSLLNILTPFL